MTLLKDYSSYVDYLITVPDKHPGLWYQKYKEMLQKEKIIPEDVSLFKNKIVYIFYSNVDKNTMEELCKKTKSVYFMNTANSKNIDIVCSLSHIYNNFYSCLISMSVDEYLNSINNLC